MRVFSALLFSIPLSLAALTQAHDAAACGGCLGPPTEVTQVTGHKMVLSISKTQTTLWDQITYSGNPSSFAWILPVKGTVDFALSSDALFQSLEQSTQVSVTAPSISCPPPPEGCDLPLSGASEAADNDGKSVNVLAQDVVGPFEMVLLQSTDSTALTNWLSMHKFNLPADIAPVVEAYVKEQFNFLALKLVPGQDVASMRPVRVTTQGASPVLPLRMVAAGTGAVTPITLWVLGEGRYEPASLPTFTINESQLIWNWDTRSSNYAALQKAAFESYQGKAWQTEAAEPFNSKSIQNQLENLVQFDPEGSGYTGDMDKTPEEALEGDMQALVGGISASSLWITRLHAELSRAALVDDLRLDASTNQDPVKRFLTAASGTGAAPMCPSYSFCGGDNGKWDFWGDNGNGTSTSSSSCAMTEGDSSSVLWGGFALGAALTLSRLRRRRR
jgi:MYXO-CTERM domain-containing protein